MLIPLGVLALGAVFSGMLWYNNFFGDDAKMRSWFGMEAAAEHAEAGTEEHADEAASTEDHADATVTTEDQATEEAAPVEEAAATTGEHGALVAGAAPKGAIFMGPENHMIHEAHDVPKWVKLSPFIAMLIGFALAWLFYIKNPSLPGRLAAQQRPLYLFLLNKWYFDELYDWVFVRPAKWLGNFLWKKGDGKVIDGALNGVAMGIIPFFTRLAGRAQSGYLFHYAFAMVLGIVALVTWMTVFGGAK